MKKTLLILAATIAMVLTSCNQQIFDFNFKFTKAYC